jgi:hypothetical protein
VGAERSKTRVSVLRCSLINIERFQSPPFFEVDKLRGTN